MSISMRKGSIVTSGFVHDGEPTMEQVMNQRRPSNIEAIKASGKKTQENTSLTGASALTVRQSLVPLILVTSLFFLWGFAYGLLDTLNSKFQVALNVTSAEAGGLQAAYFGAYFVAPLTFAGWIVRRFGYRWAFITGLVIYGIGALMFWPSAVYGSFGGFCGSLFIVGCGLSTLETSANPYIATCGPPRLSEFRLELSQSVQATGSVIAPLLAARVFFNSVNTTDLSNVQWTYLGIACFVFLLSIVFYFAPIPEISDADMAFQAEQCSDLTGYQDKPLRKQYKLFFGVAAQFCYVGGQVAVASRFINYAETNAGISLSQASDRYAIAQGVFAIGRFAAAGIMLYVKPRIVLMVFMTGVMLFLALACGIHGEAGIAMLTIVLFFESCVFPLILTLSIRGLGRHTKRGASWIVAAVSGGALFPAITGLAVDANGGTTSARANRIGMVVPISAFIISFIFPIYLNTVCKKELDGFRETRIGYTDNDGTIGDIEHDKRTGSIVQQREVSPDEKAMV